jgi:hypothetical protein
VLATALVLVVLGAVGLAAWWWLGLQSPAERRYHANVERRVAERRIDALVRQGMARLLDEAQRHGRAGQ